MAQWNPACPQGDIRHYLSGTESIVVVLLYCCIVVLFYCSIVLLFYCSPLIYACPVSRQSGWLFKKGGGKESAIGGPISPGRSNWNRRWFHLHEGFVQYWDSRPQQQSPKPALFIGDLRDAKTDEDGILRAQVRLNDKRERYILEVQFAERTLTIGTGNTVEKEDPDAVHELREWQWALYRCPAPSFPLHGSQTGAVLVPSTPFLWPSFDPFSLSASLAGHTHITPHTQMILGLTLGPRWSSLR